MFLSLKHETKQPLLYTAFLDILLPSARHEM